jgi:hypothetical protein
MSIPKSIAFVISTSLLYFGLIIASAAFMGAGHGSGFFLMAILAPFSPFEVTVPIGIAFWPAIAVLLAFRHKVACRKAAAIALAAHYAGILIVSFRTDWSYVRKVWNSKPIVVGAVIVVYVASQAIMWTLITRKKNANNQTPSPVPQ